MLNRRLLTTAMGLALPVLAGCGGGTSTVTVHATGDDVVRQALGEYADVRSEFSSIVVNVVSVRVHVEADDDGGDEGEGEGGGWYDLQLQESEGFYPLDLYQLLIGADGDGFLVAEGEVPSGRLTEIRFVLDEDQGEATLADGTTTVPVRVPSGSQSGLKLKGGFDLVPDELHDYRIRFDAEASIHPETDGSVRVQPVVQVESVESEVDDDHDATTEG